jgi:Lon protease-like protein
MKNQTLNLPIFPLDIFLLPEGVTRLKIFEPKYLKMVATASQGKGFVISLASNNVSLPAKLWGSWVKIINFGKDLNGILEVDVKCKSLVEIISVSLEVDNLYHGNVIDVKHWSDVHLDPSINTLSRSLIKVFNNNTILNELYPIKSTNNPSWVVSRWLEILPVDESTRNIFIEKSSFIQAKEFVEEIISK